MTAAVLIVDDSLTVRMDLGDAFAAAGFQPTLCTTIAEAKRELDARPFALVVVDVLLPGAHEGIFMEPNAREVARLFLEQLVQAQRQQLPAQTS